MTAGWDVIAHFQTTETGGSLDKPGPPFAADEATAHHVKTAFIAGVLLLIHPGFTAHSMV